MYKKLFGDTDPLKLGQQNFIPTTVHFKNMIRDFFSGQVKTYIPNSLGQEDENQKKNTKKKKKWFPKFS